MESLLVDVNWTAVVVSTVAAFMVGWVWYSPMLFATKWLEGISIPPTDNSPMKLAMITQIIATFLLAWVVGVLATTDSLALTVLIALTISAIIEANGLFTQKSYYAIAVESGFIIVMVAIMVLTHAVL